MAAADRTGCLLVQKEQCAHALQAKLHARDCVYLNVNPQVTPALQQQTRPSNPASWSTGRVSGACGLKMKAAAAQHFRACPHGRCAKSHGGIPYLQPSTSGMRAPAGHGNEPAGGAAVRTMWRLQRWGNRALCMRLRNIARTRTPTYTPTHTPTPHPHPRSHPHTHTLASGRDRVTCFDIGGRAGLNAGGSHRRVPLRG